MVSPAQDTPNDSKLAPQLDEGYDSKCNATTAGGGSKVLGAKVEARVPAWLAALLRSLWLGLTAPWSGLWLAPSHPLPTTPLTIYSPNYSPNYSRGQGTTPPPPNLRTLHTPSSQTSPTRALTLTLT